MRRFGRFWWDFIVGDDWRVAVGVALALGVTAVLATTWASAWVVLPLAVAAVLWMSVRSVARRQTPTSNSRPSTKS
jgi:membrane protein implicated in regulation of membrane protease activity